VKPLPHKNRATYYRRVTLRRGAILTLALLLLPLLSSCVSVLSPTGWTPVTFDGDTAYLTTSKGRISALAMSGDSATAKWTFPDKDNSEDKKLKTRAIYGAPIIEDDRVYIATFEGGVFALDKATGRPTWPNPEEAGEGIDGDIAGGLAASDDFLFFGTTEGRLYAIKKSDGTPAPGWEKPKSFDGGIWASPVVSGESVFVATMKGEVHAVSVADGSQRWEPFRSDGAIAELQLLENDLLFAPSVNHHTYLIRTANGELAGEYEADDWVWSTAASNNGRIFFGDFGGTVHGVDITPKVTPAWEASVEDERVRAGAVVINGVVVVADRKPVVTFFDAANGTVLNRVPILDSGTVRADLTEKDGSAYVATTSGKLFRAEPDSRRVVEIQLSGVKK
jgi:outer membrane protein assembly factor BamB